MSGPQAFQIGMHVSRNKCGKLGTDADCQLVKEGNNQGQQGQGHAEQQDACQNKEAADSKNTQLQQGTGCKQ